MRRAVLVVVVMAGLVVGGCGGGDGSLLVTTAMTTTTVASDAGAASMGSGSAEPDTEVVGAWVVADAVVALHGPDGGFAAVLYALDGGYSAEQVAAAALAGSLGADGVIEGVAPVLEPYGLIAVSDQGTAWGAVLVVHGRLAAEGETVTPGEVTQAVVGYQPDLEQGLMLAGSLLRMGWALGPDLDEGTLRPARDGGPVDAGPVPLVEESGELTGDGARVLISAVVGLVDVGYPFDEALAAVLVGDWKVRGGVAPFTFCAVLLDAEGNVVRPTGTASEVLDSNRAGGCYGALTEGFFDEGTEEPDPATAAPEPPTDPGNQPERAYRVEGGISVTEGDGAYVVNWSGTFAIDGESVVGSGVGKAISNGACSIEDGPSFPYDFTVDWSFTIGGSVDGEGEYVRLLLTPTPGSAVVVTGPSTETEAFCVDIARDSVVSLAEFPLGGDPETEMVVPVSGGTISLGEAPFTWDFTVEKLGP